MTGKTDYTEIYANAIYNNAGPLTCNFPIKYFTNSDYRITYNIWLIGTTGGTANIILENKKRANKFKETDLFLNLTSKLTEK